MIFNLTKMISNWLKFWFTLMISVMSLLGLMMSSSWLMIWLFLEMNLMSIMPLLSFSVIYYFIIQSLGGMIFLFGSINKEMLFLMIGLMIKLAIFPFSFWVPTIINDAPWMGGALLSSVGKLMPLFTLLNFKMMNNSIFFFITVMWGSFYGVFQTKVKKILACSSVSHTGWLSMLLTLKIKNNIIYFISYFPLIFMLFLISKNSSNKYWKSLSYNKLTLLTILLILSGLPPFSGMWAKILTFMAFSFMPNMFFIMFFIMSAFNLFFYFKIIIGFMSNKYLKMNFKDMIFSLSLMVPQFII
uniref:NADH-ubiquinone oxidoreductase chain 2 n=1 Tax=Bryozoa sp. TaxID=2813608 RepID=A0AAU8L1A5_9BILA